MKNINFYFMLMILLFLSSCKKEDTPNPTLELKIEGNWNASLVEALLLQDDKQIFENYVYLDKTYLNFQAGGRLVTTINGQDTEGKWQIFEDNYLVFNCFLIESKLVKAEIKKISTTELILKVITSLSPEQVDSYIQQGYIKEENKNAVFTVENTFLLEK